MQSSKISFSLRLVQSLHKPNFYVFNRSNPLTFPHVYFYCRQSFWSFTCNV